MIKLTITRLLRVVVLVMILTACEGVLPNTNNPTPAQPNPTNPAMPGTPAQPSTSELAEAFKLVNELRSKEHMCGSKLMVATTSLAYNSLIEKAANKHAQDMAFGGFQSHTTQEGATNYPVGYTAKARIESEGVPEASSLVGETISYERTSMVKHIEAFMGSPEHCKLIMSPNFTYLGVGYVTEDSTHNFVYTNYLVFNFSS